MAPASAEAAATAVADVREERERVSKYLARLQEVRHKRSAMEVHNAAYQSVLMCRLPDTECLMQSTPIISDFPGA